MAVEMKLIAKSELSRVIVDSTVQQKAIAHPTDSRLLYPGHTGSHECATALVGNADATGCIDIAATHGLNGHFLNISGPSI